MSTSEWAPEVADVGALLRARTKDNAGNEVGTFTENTRPNQDQVERLITSAQDYLVGEFGGDKIRPLYVNTAKQLTTLKAAMGVEISYFPEQVGTGRSAYAQLKEEFDDELRRLRGQTIIVNDASVVEEGEPDYSFPKPRLRLTTGF